MLADQGAASLKGRSPGGKPALLDQLLCLEEAPQVEHLPCSQPNETAHGEYAEVQHTCVGGFCRENRRAVTSLNHEKYIV